MDVLKEIISWSQTRPLWQRDALRRALVQGGLCDQDVEELVGLCKAENGALPEGEIPPTARPLNVTHAPASTVDGGALSLRCIRDVQDVNGLATGQLLEFQPDALTVIFGDNASGKTGYTRILKQVCRTRGRSDGVLPNVFGPEGVPSATIEYEVDSDAQVFPWRADQTDQDHLSDLGKVTVFDALCAMAYVGQQLDVFYRPFGLDLFDRLASVCGRVREELQRDQTRLNQPKQDLDHLRGPTQVGQFVEALTGETTLEDVERLARLTEADQQRLNELRDRVATLRAQDPAKQVQELRLRRDRYLRIAEATEIAGQSLDGDAIANIRQLAEAARRTREAADLASSMAFRNEPLPGVGGNAWQSLWESARRYSEADAYAGRLFPVVNDEAICVLCQQELESVAGERLTRFEEYVRDETEQKARTAVGEFEQAKRRIANVEVPRADHTKNLAEELTTYDEQTAAEYSEFVESASALRDAVLEVVPAWGKLPQLTVCPAARIKELARKFEAEAAELGRSADPTARDQLEAELAELKARERLGKSTRPVLAEIRRLRLAGAIQDCINSTSTTALSRKSGELSAVVVNDALHKRFQREIDSLHLRYVHVSLEPVGGRRGVPYYELRLQGAALERAGVDQIASESEHRSLALAAFLTELGLANDKSTIVLDDPVSSLDHLRREHVSRRLVREAKGRQVIVFSHDLVFAAMLQRESKRQGVSLKILNVRRDHAGVGLCGDGLPWGGMKVGDRLGELRRLWQEAEKAFRTEERAVYETLAQRLYGLLRETWERAVEEVLLHSVVQRFGVEVQTKRVEKLIDITADDYNLLDEQIAACSTWLPGHDQPAAVNSPLPDPADISHRIDVLDDWVKEIRRRRR